MGRLIKRGNRIMLRRKKRHLRYNHNTNATKKTKVSSVMIRGPQAIPSMYYCKLKYSESIVRNPAGAFDDYLFRGGSVFDPNQSGVGKQPYYFDQIAALYQKYRVLGSKIIVRAISNDTGQAVALAVMPTNESVSPTDIDDYASNRFAKSTVFGPSTSGKNTAFISNYMKSANIMGVSKETYLSEDDFAAAVTTNPAASWSWHIMAGALDKLTAINYSFIVDIEYYVRFEKPQQHELS